MRIFCFDDLGRDWQLPAAGVRRPKALAAQSLDDWFFAVANEWTLEKGLQVSSEGLYLINAHGLFTSEAKRQDIEGVEILKHIRLTDWLGEMRKWHAIVYSLETLDEILRRKPGDLILTSDDVTFLHLPEALSLEDAVRLAYADREKHPSLDDLAQRHEFRAKMDDTFRRLVVSDYTPPKSQHELSNWWGARQVIRCLTRVERIENAEGVPAAAESALKILRNKEALFLAGQASRGEEIDADKRARVRRERKLLREHFEEGRKPPKVVYVDDEMDKGWDEAIYLALTGALLPKDEQSWFHTSMGQLAGQGNSDDDWKLIAEMILEQDPDIILLDLRLLGSGEARIPVKDTSGGKLARYLRKEAPAVPILLLTASNKAWTVQQAFDLGVDAYWMKEGIGDHASSGLSIENTTELMRLLRYLLGDDYQRLRMMQQKIAGFNSSWVNVEGVPWWKKMEWPSPAEGYDLTAPLPPPITEADYTATFSLLNSIVRSYRDYLRLVNLHYGAQVSPEERSLWLQSIAVRVGLVVESIHRFDELRDIRVRGQKDLATSGTIGGFFIDDFRGFQWMRQDWFGQSLYDVRNTVAHFALKAPTITTDGLNSLLAALFAWLSVKPLHEEWSPAVHGEVPRRERTRAADFFSEPFKQPELVMTYEELYGSRRLNLPRRLTTLGRKTP